jgi:hypothetical protein
MEMIWVVLSVALMVVWKKDCKGAAPMDVWMAGRRDADLVAVKVELMVAWMDGLMAASKGREEVALKAVL